MTVCLGSRKGQWAVHGRYPQMLCYFLCPAVGLFLAVYVCLQSAHGFQQLHLQNKKCDVDTIAEYHHLDFCCCSG